MNNGEYNFQPEVKRTYTPEEAGHDRIRKPVSRMSRKRHRKVNVGVVIVSVVFALIIGVCIYLLATGGNTDPDVIPILDENTDVTTVLETEPPKEITVSVSEKEMHMGDLILVNYANPYAFAEEEVSEIVTVASAKNEYYLAKNNTVSLRSSYIEVINELMEDMYAVNGNKYMQVNSAYRSYEDQVSTYEYYKEANGEQYAKEYVANPGYSEHHTGLAVDFNVYVNGYVYYVESYEGCAWFRENAKNYGIILRYEPDKQYITGINGETWHYRYVGVPHAQIMFQLDYCLEEYIDYLRSYSYEQNMLCFDGTTISTASSYEEAPNGYVIYYVASEGELTDITVPNFAEYSISGNNVDGFIVTVTKE